MGSPGQSQGSPARRARGRVGGVGCQRPERAAGRGAGLGAGPRRRARLPRGWATAASAREGHRTLLPAGQRPAWPWGFVTALVPERGGLRWCVPGGRRA